MKRNYFSQFDPHLFPSPCFVVDEVALEDNLRLLNYVQQQSGAKILAALKAFSMWHFAPLISRYLSGTCSSGLNEALLGKEEFGGEVHVYSAGYHEADLREIVKIADHLVFNSLNQWQRFKPIVQEAQQARGGKPAIGLRVNPEHSEGHVALYDPCAPCSRLGIPKAQFDESLLEGISGLHFHTLCEHNVQPLQRTIQAFEAKFGHVLGQMQWVNFGGGHHITAEDYGVEELIQTLKDFAKRHQVQVYLEPGEAIAIRTGVLVTQVLDVTFNGMNLAILDTSATCHMPDTLEMPYRPDILGAGAAHELAHTYRLGGMTCLAGDVINDYSFATPLQVGDRLVFTDMAHYTMVKTTTFNGINLPSIATWNSQTGAIHIVKQFGYSDFKHRLS